MTLRSLLSLAVVLAVVPGCAAARREPAVLADCALQAAAQLYQVGLSTYQCIGAAPPADAPQVPPEPTVVEPAPPASASAPPVSEPEAPAESGDAVPAP